jgi:hypothetical protein
MRVATCTSSPVDDQLAEYLPAPADSNILAVQRRTTSSQARDEDEAMLRYVFGGDRPKELEPPPQRTTL